MTQNSLIRWYLGSFGSGFNDGGWNRAYDWLSNQDVFHVGVESKSACNDVSEIGTAAKDCV